MRSQTLLLPSLLFLVHSAYGSPISDPLLPQAEVSESEKDSHPPKMNAGVEGAPLNISELFPPVPQPPALRQAASQAASAAASQDIDVLGQVNKILQNVASLNLAGVVEESLNTASSPAVQEFVNGIVRGVFCNPISSLFNTCTSGGSGTGTASSASSSASSSSSSSGNAASTVVNSLGGTGNSNLGSLVSLFG